ncbi:MAG: hypothetical protein HQL72_08165 [Magnetococcales bacterium]|nr:hypothetical protein [Magnetococcales bacterium]
MKQANPPTNSWMIRAGVLLFCGLMLTTVFSDASAVGTWSYPKSEAERVTRESILERQLATQEESYESQFKLLSSKEKALADLEGRIKAAKEALNFKKQPLNAAIEKYRQAQILSLLDPMISTEPQRMELIEVKQETQAMVREYEEKWQVLVNQLPEAKAHVASAREQLKTTLREIDGLMRHRDAVRELVFLRNVAD